MNPHTCLGGLYGWELHVRKGEREREREIINDRKLPFASNEKESMADRVYPAPAPRPPPSKPPLPPPALYPARPRPRPLRSFSACICCSLFTFIVVIVVAALVAYFVLQPRLPTYSIQDVRISQFNVTSTFLSSDVFLTINARNPNKKIGIYYDDVKVSLSYEGVEIGDESIAPFYQGHKNTTVLQLEMKYQDVAVGDEVGTTLKNALADKSSIWLKVTTKARARVKIGSWKSWGKKIKVTCVVKMSAPTAPGSARVLSKSCKVSLGLSM